MTVLIIGASRVFGLELVQGNVAAGRNMAFSFCREEFSTHAGKREAESISSDVQCFAYQIDRRDSTRAHEVCTRVLDEIGYLEALANSAGSNGNGLAVPAPDEEWHDVLATNPVVPFLLAHEVLALALAADRGSPEKRRIWSEFCPVLRGDRFSEMFGLVVLSALDGVSFVNDQATEVSNRLDRVR